MGPWAWNHDLNRHDSIFLMAWVSTISGRPFRTNHYDRGPYDRWFSNACGIKEIFVSTFHWIRGRLPRHVINKGVSPFRSGGNHSPFDDDANIGLLGRGSPGKGVERKKLFDQERYLVVGRRLSTCLSVFISEVLSFSSFQGRLDRFLKVRTDKVAVGASSFSSCCPWDGALGTRLVCGARGEIGGIRPLWTWENTYIPTYIIATDALELASTKYCMLGICLAYSSLWVRVFCAMRWQRGRPPVPVKYACPFLCVSAIGEEDKATYSISRGQNLNLGL